MESSTVIRYCAGLLALTVACSSPSDSLPEATGTIHYDTFAGTLILGGFGKDDGIGTTADTFTIAEAASRSRSLLSADSVAFDDAGFAFSPDGSKVAFSTMPQLHDAPGTGTWEVFVMNRDGSAIRRLTNCTADKQNCTAPIWSHDGNRLFYIKSDPHYFTLYTVNADGTGAAQLSTADVWWKRPALSPSGDRLVVSQGNGVPLANMSMDGKSVTPLGPTPASNEILYSPVFSPDGARIAYASILDASFATPSGFEIRLMNADGSDARTILHWDWGYYPNDPMLQWTSDGRIEFDTVKPGSADALAINVYSILPDGSDLRQLTEGHVTGGFGLSQ